MSAPRPSAGGQLHTPAAVNAGAAITALQAWRVNIFHLNFAIPCLLVLARWLWPLSLPRRGKAVLALLLLAGSQFHFWNRLSSGSVFDPEFPRPLIILFNWTFGVILLLTVLQILIDVATLLVALVRRQRVKAPDRLRYGAAGLAALLAAVGVAGALRVPPVKDIEVALRGLPSRFDGYRLLQLTDLHISRLFPEPWARQVVQRANAAEVDLIVITGDFIDGTVAERRADVAPLHDLRAPDGVYAVPGNHEYFFGYKAWMEHLDSLGLRMLPNTHHVLARGDARVVLAGVTDFSAPRFGEAAPDLGAALAAAPAGVPVVLLDHQPRNARRNSASHSSSLAIPMEA